MFTRIKLVKRQLTCNCHLISDYATSNITQAVVIPPMKKEKRVKNSALKKSQEDLFSIPEKYLDRRKKVFPDSLYLIDPAIANEVARYIAPRLLKYDDTLICEVNPGLGYLTSSLLQEGIPKLRLFEGSSEFKHQIQGFCNENHKKLELSKVDILQLWKISYKDKYDKGRRVDDLLRGIPKKSWCDDPCLVIVGAMPKLNFLNYLMKAIALQSELVNYGRIELFVFVRPGDYLKLTSGPHMDLHTYQAFSVLYQTYCNTTLISKLPRTAFIPVNPIIKIRPQTRLITRHDMDNMYLVHIELKKDIKLDTKQRLPFYHFVKQFFKRGNNNVIAKLEEWILDVGSNIIMPDESYKLSTDIDIFTRTGELTPEDILSIYKIFYNDPKYENSSFTAMVEGELIKYETVETDLEVNKPKG